MVDPFWESGCAFHVAFATDVFGVEPCLDLDYVTLNISAAIASRL
jgi:hypothetical protein